MTRDKKTLMWRPAASGDIENILDYYIESAGVHTAVKLLRNIENVLHVIEEYPLAGSLRDEVHPGLRSFAAGIYIIFYRITADTVEIIRVLDGRQDIDSFEL